MEEGTQVPTERESKPLIKIAPLWKATNKNGTYLAGSVGDARYYILPNRNKHAKDHKDYEKTKNQPDYQLLIGERPPKESDAQKSQGDGL